MAMIDVGLDVWLGTWTNAKQYLRNAAGVVITRGRQDRKSTLTPASATMTLDNRDSRWTIRNPTGAWYGSLVQNSPVRLSVPSSLAGIPCYLRLETDDQSYVSTPAPAGAVLVQNPFLSQSASSSPTLTLAATGSGNGLLVALVLGSTATLPTLSSVKLGSTSMTQAVGNPVGNTAGSVFIYYLSNIAAGQTAVNVVTTGGTGTLQIDIYAEEWQGLATSSMLDQINSNHSASNVAAYTSNATPTNSGSNDIAFGVVTSFSTTIAGATGFTNTAVSANTVAGHQALTSTAGVAYANSGTGLSPSSQYAADVATFKVTASSSPLNITTGTLSARIDCKITDWAGNHVLFAKFGATAASWAMWTNGDGTLTFGTWDGTSNHYNHTPLPLPYFGARIAIRADYNISAQTVTWYTAPTMSGSWTQLGTVNGNWAPAFGVPSALSAGAGQPVQVGAGTTGAAGNTTNLPGMYGEVYEAQLYATASLVADPVFTSQTPGATSFADGESNTWTLAGTSELSGRLYRFHGELAALPRAADPSSRSAYSLAQAGGLTRRLTQQQTPADSAMKRAYVRLPSALNLAAYWPAEDASAATQIGQAVGQHAMTSAGLTMASSTVFQCSAAIPVMNGATATAIVDPNSVSWTDNVVRFLLAVPSGDDTNGAVVCQFTTLGTNATVRLVYNTGGVFTLTGYNAAGAQVFTNNFSTGSVGQVARVRVSVELTAAGGSHYAVWFLAPGTTAGGIQGTFSGSIGAVTSVAFGGGLSTSAMGHFSVQGVSDGINDLSQPLNAWFGETAGNRFSRLCSEEGINCRITGPADSSLPMGYQTQQTIMQLLQEIETTDQGLMTEPRQVLGLGYVTLRGLYNQPPVATADFSLAQVDSPFSPASDDTLVANDVTMTAADGSTARQILTSGAMSTAAPPSGVGKFDTQITVNPQYDSALNYLAAWYEHTLTVDEDRYPVLPFQMARTGQPQALTLLDIGNYLKLINTPSWVPPAPVKQIVAGYTETLGPQPAWQLTFNGIPESPYEIAVANDPNYGHAGTAGSTVTSNTSSGAATFQVTTTTGPLWSTSAGDYPFNVIIAGQVITWSGMSGASSPQTATVSAWGVNGVTKNLVAGQSIRIATPAIAAL